jgi:signal transduction histidine kinase
VIGLLSLTHSMPGFYTQRHARLALTIANQVAVAIENARLYEQAQKLAALEERQRIARELHDSVTQLLYGIRLYSTAASHSIRENNLERVEQDLAEIKDNALQALQEMRLLIFELHPPMLKEGGLVTALQTSLESVEARTGLQTDLKVEGINRLPASVEVELFRIAMEALNNLVKYARAKKVTIHLRSSDDRVFMDICDNGVGFDLSAAKLSSGVGLRSMEERAKRMGANLEITSVPGTGTQVKVDVRIADKANLN